MFPRERLSGALLGDLLLAAGRGEGVREGWPVNHKSTWEPPQDPGQMHEEVT